MMYNYSCPRNHVHGTSLRLDTQHISPCNRSLLSNIMDSDRCKKLIYAKEFFKADKSSEDIHPLLRDIMKLGYYTRILPFCCNASLDIGSLTQGHFLVKNRQLL